MDRLLNIMRALSDPTRLRIALLIRQLELSVGELVQILGQSQPRVSRHIRILDESGIAERRKEGSWVFLRPGTELACGNLDALFAMTDGSEARAMKRDLEKLEQVRSSRAEMAATYFAEHAGEWDKLRSLHIPEAQVESAMAKLLAVAPLGNVLDIGTGTGRMIELFAKDADRFTAIDNNAEMLRLARAKLSALPLSDNASSRVEIMIGDFNALPLADACYDTVLFHQVLHYAQAPERVITEAARVLAPSGRLMIVDFAAHDREELRSSHAHARLGFRDEMITRAFSDCGLHMAHRDTLAGGELVVKIWLGQKTSRRPGKQPTADDLAPLDTKLRIVK